MPVAGTPGLDRVLGRRGEQSLDEGHGGPGTAAGPEHGEPPPPPPQLEDGGVAFAWVQPQSQADAHVADPVAGSRRPWKNAHLIAIRASPAAAISTGIFMAGSPFRRL